MPVVPRSPPFRLRAAKTLRGGVSIVIGVLIGWSRAGFAAETPVDFARDIEPLFAQTCLACHGEKKQKGDLRLDSRERALLGGANGATLVPGKAADSLLIKRLQGLGDDPRMPKDKPAFSAAQIALVARWIDEGATWPQGATTAAAKPVHWAYVPPSSPVPPAVTDARWVRNPIDAFILSRLEREHLAPEPEADPATLARRLALDLTGLPPGPAELDAFLADRSPGAYAALVDRLLASPRFGERWARPWLDLARYADSQGYEKDRKRSQWPWRDWVIAAFNRDLPFDQFTIAQLAGDMLPGATPQDVIATGFHRNTLINEEDGVDRGEARWNTLVDRVGTTAEVWLGSTLQCAQCHNHKYDPFTQREFYRFLAFFDNADEPTVEVDTASAEERAARESELTTLARTLAEDTAELRAAERAWEAQSAGSGWQVLAPSAATSAKGTALKVLGDGSVLASTPAPSDVYTVSAPLGLQRLTALRLELLTDPSLPGMGPGAAGNGNFVLTDLHLTIEPGALAVRLIAATADYAQDGFPVADAIDAKPESGWAVSGGTGKAHTAVFTCAPLDLPAGARLVATLAQQSPYGQHLLGRLRLAATASATPSTATMPDEVVAALAVAVDARAPAQQAVVMAWYRGIAPALASARARQAELLAAAKGPSAATAMVMHERPGDGAPTTAIHVRGAWLVKGDTVTADVPAALPPLPSGGVANRLTLARWLVAPGNPLTARVTVNRFWEQIFGTGIVASSDDFGVQGQPPTHPELLDWLASDFVSHGWQVKRLLRTLVMSATYRQGAHVGAAKLERDPANRLLARAPRFRVEAEMVRDVALSAAGLLSNRIGGPSVFPLQPDGIWDTPYNGDRWETSSGEERYRRGLYTFWKRSSPYPAFTTFDAPSREVCMLRRPRTDTPLQALVTLNDVAFVDAARGLARRLAREGGATPASRCEYGFRLCTAHTADARQAKALGELYAREYRRYADDPAAAEKLASGEDAGVPRADLAALVVVANVLLNLDQTLTRE